MARGVNRLARMFLYSSSIFCGGTFRTVRYWPAKESVLSSPMALLRREILSGLAPRGVCGIQRVVGLQDGAARSCGDLGLGHDHLDLLAHLQDGLGFDDVGLGFQPLDDVHQPVDDHEVVEGRRGDGEAPRDARGWTRLRTSPRLAFFSPTASATRGGCAGVLRIEVRAGRRGPGAGLALDDLLISSSAFFSRA